MRSSEKLRRATWAFWECLSPLREESEGGEGSLHRDVYLTLSCHCSSVIDELITPEEALRDATEDWTNEFGAGRIDFTRRA